MDWSPGYREYAPPAALAHAPACAWVSVVPAAGAPPTRVLPDACTDLIWHSGAGVSLAGPDTGPLLVPSPPRDLGISERQLHRRCLAAVGYGPVLLRRVLRFRRVVSRIDAGGALDDLAGLAVEAGYADQAHLTRESRELAGLPLAALARVRPGPIPGPGPDVPPQPTSEESRWS